jgi:hypothetical protein
MAMASRPFRSASKIFSRKGAQTLADRARSGRGPVYATGGSVDTAVVVAGFGCGPCPVRPPRRRTATTATTATRRCPLMVSRRMPVSASVRQSDQPSWRRAMTCYLEGFRTWLMAVNAPQGGVPPVTPQPASRGGRISGVH